MANNISKKLEESWKKLPNAINGNGQNFIFLLKTLLGDLKDELDDKFEEISKISNAVTDAPEEMDEQLQNCKIQEVRVGTNISLVLTWDYSNVKNYDSAEIYIKETKGNIADHKNWDEVEVSRTIRTTKTDTVTVDGINAGYIYQITFQAKNTFGSVSRKSGCPVLQYAVSAMNNVPDPPLEFNVYFNKDGVLWTWKQPVNLDYSYAELRINNNIGDKQGLLEITQDTKSTVLPPYREGTAYLYNKGYGSKYSTPLIKPWSKPIPTAPQTLTAKATYQGLQFTYSPIPDDCQGICISINGKKHYTKDEKFNYYCSTGSYTYKACFYDCFGEGIWTAEQTIGTIEEIPPDAVHITKQTVFDDGVIVGKYIGDHEVVGTKIKDGTITTENLAAGCVTANELASNSVTTDKIEAEAINADKIATGSVTADKIETGAITADKLTSGAVTADKLAANTINLAGALKVVGGNVTLDENGMTVKETNGSSVLFGENGMSFVDSNGHTFAGIGRFCTGIVNDGQTVKFANPWDITPTVFLFPIRLQTSAVGYTNINMYQDVEAINVSANGFTAVCKSVLKAGSGAVIPLSWSYHPEWGHPSSPSYSYNINVPTTATHIWISGEVGDCYADYHDADNSDYHTERDITSVTIKTNTGKIQKHPEVAKHGHRNLLRESDSADYYIISQSFMFDMDLSNDSVVTVTFSIKGTGFVYSYGKLISYRTNLDSDVTICRGTAGFIAVDPNTVPYTVS